MEKLNFYDINKDYINYLKKSDSKIPDINYSSNDKFVCGVILKINSLDYYAPISSFNKKQYTNILIYDKQIAVASIRFSFMFPVPKSELSVKNIKEEPNLKYKRLLNKELKYCNSIREDIAKMALKIYKIGTNPKHFHFKNCCKFEILELKCKEYE